MRRSIAGLVALTVAITAGCGAETQDAGATNEGIAVHGDWTIDIYNEDGTLDEHVEFSNALTSGAELLAILLTGQSPDGASTGPSIDEWVILFGVAAGPGGTDPCDTPIPSGLIVSDNPDLGFACVIADDGGGNSGVDVGIGADGQSVLLSGSAEVTQDGAFVNWVETIAFGAYSDSPNPFPGNLFRKSFTGTSIPDQSVSAGQTVQVEVEISFTTG